MSTRWNNKIQFPSDSDFINRIVSASFGPSESSGNPMITLDLELVSPDEKEVAGEMIDISGTKTTMYVVTKNLQDEEKSANNLKACKELYEKLFPNDPSRAEKFNPDNPDLTGLKGMQVYTQMSGKADKQFKNPTAKQLEEGKKKGLQPKQIRGDVQKNPITGKELIVYWPQINEIFGPVPASVAAGVSGRKPF